MDEDLINLCVEFNKRYPMKDEDNDAREFLDTVGEVELITFFRTMYMLLRG